VTSDDDFLETLCKKHDVNYALSKNLKAKILPLLEEAHRRLGYRFDKTISKHRKGTDIRLANSAAIESILKRITPHSFSVRERTMITLHFEYSESS
jgi:hypothetical protein